jgi:predicted small metal-binding protein
MPNVLKCKDIEGLNTKCPFEWHGQSEDAVVYNAVEHIVLWHRPRNIPEVLWAARNAVRAEETALARAAGAA